MKLISSDHSLNLSTVNIMGILNITPDSFSDGKKYQHLKNAIDHTYNMINSGANIIDIGGESTRPGAKTISEEEEATRVIPVLLEIKKRFDIFISINTSKALVMRESIKAGINLINDNRSLSEKGTISVALSSNIPICLMHMQGKPSYMQKSPYYKNVIIDIKDYFKKKITYLKKLGIKKNRLIIDPGFGFGKTLNHNYSILSQLSSFHDFKLPIMVGMSRKSMIGKLTNLNPKKRIFGSIACAVIAALQGIHIIRVHDVHQTIEAIKIVKFVLQHKKNIFK